jgi:hypothetical protein
MLGTAEQMNNSRSPDTVPICEACGLPIMMTCVKFVRQWVHCATLLHKCDAGLNFTAYPTALVRTPQEVKMIEGRDPSSTRRSEERGDKKV